MTTRELMAYAETKIESLGLGPSGPLGTEFVVAYDDAGEDAVRISDGHGESTCSSREQVDLALQSWVDWIGEIA